MNPLGPKPKPHNCKKCGETSPGMFYPGRKGECRPCVVQTVADLREDRKNLGQLDMEQFNARQNNRFLTAAWV